MTDKSTGDNARPSASWYALYTRHQHEKIAAESLALRGFEVFLPLYEEIRKWSDRRKKLHVPLFPCYVFVQSSLDRKVDILVTAGVREFVTFDGNPAPIPNAEMEDLRRVAEAARIEPHPFLRYGDWVKVKSGPFEGIEGFLVRRKGQARLVLSVEMLEKSVSMEIDALLTERIWRSNFPPKPGWIASCASSYGACD